MDIVGIIIAILVFSALIIIHELGHFLMARKCGVFVKEFSLGLGPTLIKFDKGETAFSLKLLPFGGACLMEGEDDISDSPSAFINQKVWKRILIVAAGPVFNLITAFICAIIIIAWFGSADNSVAALIEGSPAYEAGIEAGDRIIKLNNDHVFLQKEIRTFVQMHGEEEITVTLKRNGKRIEKTIRPVLENDGCYILGYNSDYVYHPGIFETIRFSVLEMRYWVKVVFEGLTGLIGGKYSINDLSGPVGIVSVIDETYQASRPDGLKYVLANIVNICIMLSVNLGIMNLLPLPALDGGRLVFLLIEAVTRKRVPVEIEGKVHFFGIVILLALMIVIMFNDVRALL